MTGAPLAGRSVLVIDDEPLLCDLLARWLTQAGAIVRTASSASAALAMVTAGATFDLALVDKRLGDADGVALIGRLRGLQPTMAPVIMTGFASVEDSLAALDAGAVGYLLKPFSSLDEVVRELEEIATREERRRRATIPPAGTMTMAPLNPARRSQPPPEAAPVTAPAAFILLALPRAHEHISCQRALEGRGFAVERVATLTALGEAMTRRSYDAIAVDVELPDGEGIVALERARTLSKRAVLVLVGALPPLAVTTRLLRLGQTIFVRRPIEVNEQLVPKIEQALGLRRESELRRT